MRGTQGALVVASALQIIVGFSGLWRNVVRYRSPLSVHVTDSNRAPSKISSCPNVFYIYGSHGGALRYMDC